MIDYLMHICLPILLVVCIVVAAAIDARRLAVSLSLIGLMVAPGRITRFSGDSVSGVAESVPEISVFLVVTVVMALMSFHYRMHHRVPVTLVLLGGYFLLGMAFFWDANVRSWAGIVEYLLAPLAWMAGAFLFHFTRESVRNAVVVAGAVLAALVIQVFVTGVQLLGGGFNARAADSEVAIQGRVNGTVGHPNTLGKIAFLALLILLPLTRHEDRRVVRLATAGLVSCFFLFIVTGGRANFIAALLALAAWALLLPRNYRSPLRWLYWFVTGIAAIAAALTLSARFEEDPLGGSRSELLDAALRAIPNYLMVGMGPNQYLPTMTVIDPAAARAGLPVHNSVLLATLELGIIGGIMLFGPWIWLTLRSVLAFLRGQGNDYSRVGVCSVAPILVIALTGYGMVADGILPLWFIVLGLCDQGVRAVSARSQRSRQAIVSRPSQEQTRGHRGDVAFSVRTVRGGQP